MGNITAANDLTMSARTTVSRQAPQIREKNDLAASKQVSSGENCRKSSDDRGASMNSSCNEVIGRCNGRWVRVRAGGT